MSTESRAEILRAIVNGSWVKDAGFNLKPEGRVPQYDEVVNFVKTNQLNVAMFVFFIALAIQQIISKNRAAAKAGATREYLDAPDFPEIEEGDRKFDWRHENPIKLRTFKPKYYLTMDMSDETAIQNLNPSELLTMDRTYADRIAYRKKIIQTVPEGCVGVFQDERVRPAVSELYIYLMGHYLPKRYPTMFKLHFAQFDTGAQFMLENLLTKQIFPTQPTVAMSTASLLKTLGMLIDEDFLFLLPETDEESDDPKYVLQAYVCICPSGWSPPEKLGKRLAAIHGPVPGYKDILQGSMDRYFKAIEVGKYVKRSNWAITLSEELFMPDASSNHGVEGQELKPIHEIDPDKVFLRCERQTLHRLPQSKAVVFAFKTYMDSMRDIKLEGLGDELADAIDGIKAGNVPALAHYKKAPVWGGAVKEYLRA